MGIKCYCYGVVIVEYINWNIGTCSRKYVFKIVEFFIHRWFFFLRDNIQFYAGIFSSRENFSMYLWFFNTCMNTWIFELLVSDKSFNRNSLDKHNKRGGIWMPLLLKLVFFLFFFFYCGWKVGMSFENKKN